MLAGKGALRKRSGGGGPFIVHMRLLDEEDREQRHTMFPKTIDRRGIANDPPTEIVMCLQ